MHAVIRRAVRVLIVLSVIMPGGMLRAQEARAAGLYRESYVLEAKRDYTGALTKARDARAAGGNAYFSAIRIGWLEYLQGDFKASIASYSEAVATDPKAIEAKLGLTLPLLAQRNWRELERACSAVLAVDGRNATALARLGLAQYSAGNFSGAEATYRRLTEDYPSEMDYRTGLGWALLKLGKSAEAKAIFDGVLAVSPDNVNAKAGLGVR
jgi:tetratricopeptide (TPR) repeat protein